MVVIWKKNDHADLENSGWFVFAHISKQGFCVNIFEKKHALLRAWRRRRRRRQRYFCPNMLKTDPFVLYLEKRPIQSFQNQHYYHYFFSNNHHLIRDASYHCTHVQRTKVEFTTTFISPEWDTGSKSAACAQTQEALSPSSGHDRSRPYLIIWVQVSFIS